MRIVYKMCVLRGTGPVSIVSDCRVRRHYTIGKVTKPKFGYLYAFKSLFHAMDFSENYSPYVIFKCEALTVRDEPSLRRISIPFKEWWELKLGGYKPDEVLAPEGTIWCKWIKPIEIVNES